MTSGELWVRASIWLAVSCYPAGPAARLGAPRFMRVVWTSGCLAFLVHVVASFHVHYGWSHAVALRETARQTAELTGRAVAAGLYVNYLFAVLWALDVCWWWCSPERYQRRDAWIDGALHGFLLFVLFNGTVVFGRGPVRWLGLGVTLVSAAALVVSSGRRRVNA